MVRRDDGDSVYVSRSRTRNVNGSSSSIAQPIAEEILQLRDRVDLLDRRLDVVLHAAIANRAVVKQDIARPRIAVARLADGADVAERLAVIELVDVLDLLGAGELVD